MVARSAGMPGTADDHERPVVCALTAPRHEATHTVMASHDYRREGSPTAGDTSSSPAATLWVLFEATGALVARVRHDVAAWLKELAWPTEAAQDILLAIYEALANVVDHAYRGEDHSASRQGRLYLWQILDTGTQQRRVVANITDYGRWKLPTTPPQPATAAAQPPLRGRGLMMMAACMEYVDVQPSAGGTTVILTSHHAPPAIPPLIPPHPGMPARSQGSDAS